MGPKRDTPSEDPWVKCWTAEQSLRMLGPMWTAGKAPGKTPRRIRGGLLVTTLGLAGALMGVGAWAQSCTTQAKATPEQRAAVGAAAFRLASAVQRGDAAGVRSGAAPELTADFAPTAGLVQSTSAALHGDTLAVTQMFLLDASKRPANDTADAEFTCPLTGSAAETAFSIAGLPPGRYAFVMVEATGPQPFVLSLLLQDGPEGWKMAGFYPHRREAGGHDGLWYWTVARADAKDGKPWLAWVLYGEADQLLRPASFVASTNLYRLRSELRSATPPALSDGVSETTPLAMAGTDGAQFRITGLGSDASVDGRELNLVVHLRGEGSNEAQAALLRDAAAGDALLKVHPELRIGFGNLVVVSEAAGSNPVVSVRPMAEVAAGR